MNGPTLARYGVIFLFGMALAGCAVSAVESYNRGIALEEKGEYAQAEKALLKAIAADPDDPQNHNALGLLYCRLGMQESGLIQFEKALRLRPEDPRYLRNKGIALGNLDRLEEAEKCLTKALAKGASDANYQLGRLCMKQGRIDDAAHHFEQALKVDPNNDEAREWLLKANARITQ